MRTPISIFAAIATLTLCTVAGYGQQAPSAGDLNARALDAYRSKQYGRFLQLERQALATDPRNVRIIYNVAAGEALLGHADEAVAMLGRLLARKLDFGAENDPDFAGIRTSTEWTSYLSGLRRLRMPIVRSSRAFTLPDRSLVAVGIAEDDATGDVYIASALERKIVRRAADGAVSDFISPAQDGFLGGGSLALDAPRHLLYATTAAAPFMTGYRPGDAGRTGVFAFDLGSGKLARRAWLNAPGNHHFLNALAVDARGDVYVSDTGASGIYVLRPEAKSLQALVASDAFPATQGLALSADGRTLYVADWRTGLWSLDLPTLARKRFEEPPSAWLEGMDGISRVRDGFIAVQLGAQPARVLHIRMDDRWSSIVSVEILEMNHPDYSQPIQGMVSGDAFWYIADSQVALIDPKTNQFDAQRAQATVVLKLPLEQGGP